MSAFSAIYTEMKKDGFRPRMEATGFGENDDLSVWMHPEVPECQWLAQWTRRNWPWSKAAVAYWNPAPRAWGMWALVDR